LLILYIIKLLKKTFQQVYLLKIAFKKPSNTILIFIIFFQIPYIFNINKSNLFQTNVMKNFTSDFKIMMQFITNLNNIFFKGKRSCQKTTKYC